MNRRQGPTEAKPFGLSQASINLSDREFDQIRAMVKEKTGISLGLQKRDLVVSRLARRLRARDMTTFSEYLEYLETQDDGGELVEMINQITTNKTDFFREKHHFEYLNDHLLPRLAAEGEAKGQKRIRLWSAGCSYGAEPYTLAMVLAEFFAKRPGWDVRILATDLDTTMLARASEGMYDDDFLSPVPKAMLSKYFERDKSQGAPSWKARPAIRDMITFRKFNLIHPTYPFKVKLDFVFCRNVLIYFDQAEKIRVLTKMHGVLKPDGLLFVGHSESLMMVKDLFRYEATTVYRRI